MKQDSVRELPPTARGRRTRQAILDAAEHVFGDRGFHEAGIVEITQRAKVAPGTFYLYFPDKRAVFEDLVRLLNHRLRADIQAAVAGLPDRVDTEVAGFEAFFAFTRKHRDLYRVIRQAEFVDESLYRWHYRTLAKGYRRGLRAAQGKGQLAAGLDPEALPDAPLGRAESLGMRWVLWERRLPGAPVGKAIRALLERGVRPARRTGAGR